MTNERAAEVKVGDRLWHFDYVGGREVEVEKIESCGNFSYFVIFEVDDDGRRVRRPKKTATASFLHLSAQECAEQVEEWARDLEAEARRLYELANREV